ncbi:MAG: multicopper oxidase family protein, partial [Pseudonocardiaceae bacterium]
LNASNARRYRLTLAPGGDLVQIGSDGGLLAAPVVHQALDIAPGERFDVVVDFAGYPVGSEVTLANQLGTGRTSDVLRFRVVRPARDDSQVPRILAAVPKLRPGPVAREWRFTRGRVGGHGGWTINKLPFDPSRVDAQPRLDETETWRFVSDLHHPIHVHLDPFQVVRRGGGPPGPFDGGWKDTVDVRPGEVVDVAVRFTQHRGRYLIHCHNLEHEDMAMMATFATV